MNVINQVGLDRKSERHERKKRKLVAFANAANLNDETTRNKKYLSNDQRVDSSGSNDNRDHSDKTFTSFIFSSSSSFRPNMNSCSPTAVVAYSTSATDEQPISKKHRSITIPFTNDTWQDLNHTKNKVESLTNDQRNLTDEEYALLKKELRERKIFLTRIPRIRVRDDGEKALLEMNLDKRIPLFTKDIQHMLVYLLFGPYLKPFNSSPRWCTIEKFTRVQTITLTVIEGFSSNDFIVNRHKLPSLDSLFSIKVDVVTPYSYEGDVVTDIVAVSMSDNDRSSLLAKFGNDVDGGLVGNNAKVFRLFESSTIMPSTTNTTHSPCLSRSSTFIPDKVPRTNLLLSLWQMAVENYPVPIRGELCQRYSTYRKTKDVYHRVSDSSPLFAMDCEMCTTIANENELTRITIVNEKSQIVYESLVKPRNKIINYLTKYSGITEDMLRHVNKRLEHVQNDVINLLPPDAILVGHSLNTDLHALKLMHPYVIDTSVIYNLSGERWRKPKLQTLARQYLGLKIQENAEGHDSVEDSISSLKLVQLKLSQSISYGDAVLGGTQHLTDDTDSQTTEMTESKTKNTVTFAATAATTVLATSLFDSLARANKRCTIVSSDKNIKRYRKFVTHRANVDGDNEDCGTNRETYCHFINTSTTKGVLRHSLNAINDESKFVLIHASIDEETDKDKFISKLDSWYSKLWQRSTDNSAHIVLFAGSTNNDSNAVCLVEMKKPFVANRKPRLD